MSRITWVKLIVLLLVLGAVAGGLCLRWGPIGSGSDPLARWGRGNPTLAERAFYVSRINRLIDEWDRTAGLAERDRDGRLKDSYRTLLVIDLDKQAVWIEQNGRSRSDNDYSELPPQMKWQLHHITPEDRKELTGRVVLKMRGLYSDRQVPESFSLIGTCGTGHFHFQFHCTGGRGSYNYGPPGPEPSHRRSSGNSEDSYGSIIVADSEYEQYVADANEPEVQAPTRIEENRANWLRAEKSLYGKIERNLRSAGYELSRLKVEPGPDFSAGYAEVRGRNDSALRGFFGGYSSPEAYLKFDYLGDDTWYAKSARKHPQRPMMPRRTLDLEFLVHATSEITADQRSDLLAKGRKIQQSEQTTPSKWKVTLPAGTVELIGICENPSAGKQWWGPDGSPVDHVPYVNTEPYGRPRADRKLYEVAWRIENRLSGGAARYSLEGSNGSYGRSIRDRYGNRMIQGLSASGYSFDKSRRKTAWSVGLSSGHWQTALIVEDKAVETKVLDKHRIILHPPKRENGQIVVRCFEEWSSRMRDHQTQFALTIWENSASKTVSMDRYNEKITDNRDTGLTEHKFVLEDVSMSQIEGVCFRYRPFEFVTFKNISLVPGEDPGFEIELSEQ